MIIFFVLLLICTILIFLEEKNTEYVVDGEICKNLRQSRSFAKLSDCESGLIYVNPESYREIKK